MKRTLLAAKNPDKEDLHHALGNVFGLHVDQRYPDFINLETASFYLHSTKALLERKAGILRWLLLLTPTCANDLKKASEKQN